MDKNLYSFIYQQLFEIKALKSYYPLLGAMTIVKKHFHTRLQIKSVKNRRIIEFEIGTTLSDKGYFKLGLYPDNLTCQELESIKELMENLLPSAEFSTFIQYGRVSTIEFGSLEYPEKFLKTGSHKNITFL